MHVDILVLQINSSAFCFFPLRPILKVALKCPLFCSSTGHYTRGRGFGLMEKQMIIGM